MMRSSCATEASKASAPCRLSVARRNLAVVEVGLAVVDVNQAIGLCSIVPPDGPLSRGPAAADALSPPRLPRDVARDSERLPAPFDFSVQSMSTSFLSFPLEDSGLDRARKLSAGDDRISLV